MSRNSLADVANRLKRVEGELHERNETQKAMDRKLDDLNLRFSRYEAKWGGVVMVLSALLAVVLALKSEVVRLFRGN